MNRIFALVASEQVSIFIIGFLLFLLCFAAVQKASAQTVTTDVQYGLTLKDGKLYKNGKIYLGIGVNYCDLFQELLDYPDSKRTLDGLRYLSRKKIPFVRFWACGFWPSSWQLYFEDKTEWFRRLDIVIATAEENGIGLIPSLFWRPSTYPDLFDEYAKDWAEPNSKTRQFMATYIGEVVTRYKNSPAIWAWEFGNEMNLEADLPNAMDLLGKKIPHLGVNLEKDERNILTYKMVRAAYIAFAQEVHKYDTYRIIITGNSLPRASAYHIAMKLKPTWGDDNAEQAFKAFKWFNPEAFVPSIHFYGKHEDNEIKYAGAVGTVAVLKKVKEFTNKINKPLFVGEFAGGTGKPGEYTLEEFTQNQKRILSTILDQNIDLSAYWVFDYTPQRKSVGLVRKDNNYSWVLDQIAEYNKRKHLKQMVSILSSAFPEHFLEDATIALSNDVDRPTVFGEPAPPEGFAGPDPTGKHSFGIYVPENWDDYFKDDISIEQWIFHEMFHLHNRRTGEYQPYIDKAFPDDNDPLVQWIKKDPYHATFAPEEAFINLITFADPPRTEAQKDTVREWFNYIGAKDKFLEEIKQILNVIEHW